MRSRTILGLALFAATLAAACGTATVPHGACTSAADCGPAATCITGGVCARTCDPDAGSSQCPTGMTCQSTSGYCQGTQCTAVRVVVCQ